MLSEGFNSHNNLLTLSVFVSYVLIEDDKKSKDRRYKTDTEFN